jgi:hypothetical protein
MPGTAGVNFKLRTHSRDRESSVDFFLTLQWRRGGAGQAWRELCRAEYQDAPTQRNPHTQVMVDSTAGVTAGAFKRMRAALDPGWQGEMPRTIILRADGKRHASSGLLTPETLDAALAH